MWLESFKSAKANCLGVSAFYIRLVCPILYLDRNASIAASALNGSDHELAVWFAMYCYHLFMLDTRFSGICTFSHPAKLQDPSSGVSMINSDYLLHASSSVINQKDALRKLPGIGYDSTYSVPAVSPRSHKAGKVTASSVKGEGMRNMERKDGREVSRVYSQPNERLVCCQYIPLTFALFFPISLENSKIILVWF